MRKTSIGALLALPLALGMGLVAASPAVATDGGDEQVCHAPDTTETRFDVQKVTETDWVRESPGEGWVEIESRDVPPVGEPTLTIDNPDYVPEQTIEHPAEYETVHHDAVYEDRVVKVEYKKWKIFWWDYKWFPVNAQPDEHSGWKKTGEVKTERVKVKDAWDEQVLVNPAWIETIPAQGEPTLTVENPDYVPGYTEYRFRLTETQTGLTSVPDDWMVTNEYPITVPGEQVPCTIADYCHENLFDGYEDRGGMWEITYGMQHTDTNGVPVFTNDSFGGLVLFNEGSIPGYMAGDQYRWLYVYGDQPGRTWTWDFLDGTRVTAVASYTQHGCPSIAWTYGQVPAQDLTVVTSEWEGGTPSCADPTVEQTRTVTTTPRVWTATGWQDGEPVVTTETRTLTYEGEACEPEPTTDPEPEQPSETPVAPEEPQEIPESPSESPEAPESPTVAPQARQAPQQAPVASESLPETGASDNTGALVIAGLLLLSGIGSLVARKFAAR